MMYHGTPYCFSRLKSGSWLSTSRFQAASHLFLKNREIAPSGNPFRGWVLEFPDLPEVDISEKVYSKDCVHVTNRIPLKISHRGWLSLEEVIRQFHSLEKQIFFSAEVTDLMPFIKEGRQNA